MFRSGLGTVPKYWGSEADTQYTELEALTLQWAAAHASVALADSTGHASLISIGIASGWTPEKLWAIAQDGLKKNPQDDAFRPPARNGPR